MKVLLIAGARPNFIASGKMYDAVKQQAGDVADSYWNSYNIKEQTWYFLEFGFRCDKWKRFYRTFYTRCLYEGRQMLLDFARPDNVILTNIGINDKVLENCTPQRPFFTILAAISTIFRRTDVV